MDYSLALASLRAADPRLASVIDRVGDCHLAQDRSQGDLLATLAESILYQQLSGFCSSIQSRPARWIS
jgi:DNA-3-methyladenine glycosylase II